MSVEQGLPWHPVATGLAGQTIPFLVAASHVHALPSPPFWFPVPAVLVASPALLCPSSLSAVLALVPLPRSGCLCCSSPCLVVLLGAYVAHPLLSHPPAPPYKDFTSPYNVDCPVRGWLFTALLPPPWPGISRRAGRSPRPCGVRDHLVEGGGEVFADGSLGVRRIRWLLQCSHLMVPLCLVVCPVGARLIAVCGAALCPVPPPPPPCAGTSNILPSNQQVILGRCFQVKNQRSAVYSWFGFCTQT